MIRFFGLPSVGVVGVAALVGACGATQDASKLTYAENARQSYDEAYADLKEGDCVAAEPAFRRIRREFPYSRFAALSELRVADCLLHEEKFPEAIAAYRQFVRYRPSHPYVPYARFKIVDAYYRQIPSDWLLAPPSEERDQRATIEALQEVRKFLTDFPDNKRAPKAKKMERGALGILARHELYVARFYLQRDRPLAAIGRLRTVAQTYQGSGYESWALLLLGRTYVDMDKKAEAKKAFEELLSRYPSSRYAAEAREELQDLRS